MRFGLETTFVVALGACLIGCSSSTPESSPAPSSVSPRTQPVASTAKPTESKGGSAARRAVKDATDPDASKIDATPKDTTIEDIQSQRPAGELAGRQGPFETSTWRVKATIESVALMKDRDYYLVLKGDKGGSTVVEVPDPELCQGSPLEPEIAAARKLIEQRYHPTSTAKLVHDQATITGVGFFGFSRSAKNGKKKGATGHQGARLMPGTGIEFGASDPGAAP